VYLLPLLQFLPRLLSRGLSLSRGETYWLSTSGKHTEHHLHPALPVYSSNSQVPTRRHPDKQLPGRDPLSLHSLDSKQSPWTTSGSPCTPAPPPSQPGGRPAPARLWPHALLKAMRSAPSSPLCERPATTLATRSGSLVVLGGIGWRPLRKGVRTTVFSGWSKR